jgi:hypothetical protein
MHKLGGGDNMDNEPVKWSSFAQSRFSSMGTSFAEYTIPIIWGTMMRKIKIGLERKLRKGGRGPTHYVIDCHDFAEDDTVCGGHFSRLCFEEVVGV